MRSKALFLVVLIVVASAALGSPPAQAAPDSVQAVWVHRHVNFLYRGFTTRYSCDGLRDRIRYMLSKLGARDLEIREQGCTRLVGPATFPGVRVSMRVLVPASSERGKNAGPVVVAHWQDVVLMAKNSGPKEQSNCELIEQFKESFLPLFATRNIRYRSTCVPNQTTLGTHLSAEVLMPNARARAEGARSPGPRSHSRANAAVS